MTDKYQILLSIISILEYSITLQYKPIFITNENRRILYCQIFPKTEPPVVVLVITLIVIVLFIPFSVSSLIFARDEKWKCGRLVVSFHQDFKK